MWRNKTSSRAWIEIPTLSWIKKQGLEMKFQLLAELRNIGDSKPDPSSNQGFET